MRKSESARTGAPDALSWRERASAESHALAPALASRYAELTVQFGPLFLSCPFARGVPPPRAPTYSRAAVSPGRAPHITVVWGCAHARPPPAALAVQRPL